MDSPAATSSAMAQGAHRAVAWAGTVVALAVAVALVALAWSDWRATHQRLTEHTELMARVFADHAGRSIDAAALAAGTVDELLARGLPPEGPEVQAALGQTLVNLPFLRGVAVIDPQGLVLASHDGRDSELVIDLRVLGPLPAPGESTLGRYVPVRRLADLHPAYARPAPPGVGFLPLITAARLPQGRTAYVVAQINADAFMNFQQVTMNDERMASGLLAFDGQLLAATAGVSAPEKVSGAKLEPFTRFLPRQESGSWKGPGLREGDQIASFRLTRRWPLLLLVEFDDEAAHAQWWAGIQGPLGLGVALLAVTLVLTFVAARSVRGRQLAQANALARERELSETLARLEELVFRCDSAGRLRFVNGAWLRLFGGEAGAWRGRALQEVLAPGQTAVLAPLLGTDKAAGGTVRVLLQGPLPNAALRNFDLALRPLDTGDGFAGSAVDVTEQVLARRRLQAQLAFSELLLESSPLAMSVVGRDRRYRIVNRAWEAFTGRRREEAIGSPVGAHFTPEQQAEHEARDALVYATGEPQRYEARVPHADGTLRDLLIEKRALPGAAGDEPSGILAVMVDVTEFRAAERATREARDAAEDASRAKSEFIANISHELRTPLQSIIGFSELGLRRAGEQQRLASMFNEIHASGHRMLSLVNDLLDVARIESSAGTLHLERGDMRAPVRLVLQELEPLAAQRRVSLIDALPATPMLAKLDPLRFGQVVRNVVANAIRFSPDGSRIRIESDVTEAGEWRLRIADRGPGIPEAELEGIFEAFVQSSRTKDGSGGTGLGLAISRTIMQAHGGRISARNREGGGSVFEIVLPSRSGDTLPASLV